MIAEGSIPERLRGTRIFVTGSTGFLGTALVERLLREVPDCEVVLLVRPGKRSTVEQRVRPRDLQQRRLRPAAGRAGRRPAFDAMIARRVTVDRRRRQPDGLGLDEAGRARCWPAATSSSTRPPPSSFDSPLDGAVEVNLLGPTPHRRHAATTSASRPTSSRCRPATSPATGGARRPRSWSTRARSSSTSTGATRSTAPAGPAPTPRPTSRTPEKLAEFRKAARHELGAAGTPALAAKTEQLRARVGERPLVEAGRARAAVARLARRLRLHQGPRRAGADRDPRRRAASASCGRRSSSRRWPSRARAGSAASAWPSRSSSPTPAAC